MSLAARHWTSLAALAALAWATVAGCSGERLPSEDVAPLAAGAVRARAEDAATVCAAAQEGDTRGTVGWDVLENTGASTATDFRVVPGESGELRLTGWALVPLGSPSVRIGSGWTEPPDRLTSLPTGSRAFLVVGLELPNGGTLAELSPVTVEYEQDGVRYGFTTLTTLQVAVTVCP